MRHRHRLGLAAALVILPAAQAHAASRTVHVSSVVTSADKPELFVRFDGPYIDRAPTYTPNPGDLQTLTVDEFGTTVERTLIRLGPGMSRGMHAVDTITTGHTRHYTATFYERRGDRVVAFARHAWKAKMNLKGINTCEEVETVDPEYRLEFLLKRTDKGFTEEELRDKLNMVFDPRAAYFEHARAGNYQQALEILMRWTGAAAINMVAPGVGTITNFAWFTGEVLIKSDPGTCLSQIWIMPSIPPEERTEARMFMPHGFGAAGFTWVADFNGDGRPDIGTARTNDLNLLLSQPEGHWLEEVVKMKAERWGNGRFNWVGDFDGDGKADLASAHSDKVFVRLAADNFQPKTWKVKKAWGDDSYTFVGDFNGDGKSDLASGDGGEVFMKLSTGTGFSSKTWKAPSRWGGAGYTRVGDFNGDGKADLASANGGRVYMRLSEGNGWDFEEWSAPIDWGDDGYTFVGDFNGDGKSDLASANGGTIYLLLSTGKKFTVKKPKVPKKWGSAGYTFVGDFNGDGRADIASADDGKVYVNLSSGTAFTQKVWKVDDWWGGAGYTRVADFDGNGRADIVTADGARVRAKLSQARDTGF